MSGLRVGLMGASGAVGQEMLRGLAASTIPVDSLTLYTSARSSGSTLTWRGNPLTCIELTESNLKPLDLVLASAGGGVSRTWSPRFAALGATVIDNSSAFRSEAGSPLVVPEVNGDVLDGDASIIANPNCSTIQMVVALAPLHREWGLRAVRVATYQSVSGAGARAVEELRRESRRVLDGETAGAEIFPRPIAFNALPHIGPFGDDGETQEEAKMRHETRRILGLPGLPVSATCVRIPVERGHSEAVWAQFDAPPHPDRARELLSAAGVRVVDDVDADSYPHALAAAGSPEVFVGRIRRDGADARGLVLWVVSDNLLKGAATNALQIAEQLVARGAAPAHPGTGLMPTGVAVIGAAGRLGRAILESAAQSEDISVGAAVLRTLPDHPLPGLPPRHTDLYTALGLPGIQVVIDVALAEGLASRVETVARCGLPLVVGSTGLDAPGEEALDAAALRIPVVVAPNFSPGLTLIVRALRMLLAADGMTWQGEILDRHHAGKQDAPSGTARWLARTLAEGGIAARVQSEREGDVVGEHHVRLITRDEELELVHRATDRRVFAEGALRAVRWVGNARPGRYAMDDVVASRPDGTS